MTNDKHAKFNEAARWTANGVHSIPVTSQKPVEDVIWWEKLARAMIFILTVAILLALLN